MPTLGLVVKAGARPSVICVTLDGSQSAPAIVDVFTLQATDNSLVEQIDHLAQSLSSKLSGLTVDAVVIRIADFARQPNRRPASDWRLMIEGALAYASRKHCPNVLTRCGKDLGECMGTSKADVDSRAKLLNARAFEAVAAGLSELPAS